MLYCSRFAAIVSMVVLLYPAVAGGGEPARASVDKCTVLLLPLDEGKGDRTTDASSNQFAAEIHGAQWNVGRSGYGLAFDGSGVYVDVPSDPKLCPKKAVTVEAWVKLEHANVDTICKNQSYFMRIAGGLKAYFYVDGKWRILQGNKAVAPHEWTHVAMTYDCASRTMRTFIDGALDAEKKLDGLSSYELGQSGGPLRIGRNTWRVTGGVVGKVDEVRISSVARSFEPMKRSTTKIANVYVPNGSFEFGRYGWRANHESNSRLQWQLDASEATHGRWSLRSSIEQPTTIITKPFPFSAGPGCVLSADFKADAPGRKVTLQIVTTHHPRRARTHSRRKGFEVGTEWTTVTVPVKQTEQWQTGYVYASISKHDGTLWVDNVRLRRADAPAGTDVVGDAFGIRLLTHRLGDTYFADTEQRTAEVHVVNASSVPRRLRVVSQVVDFFGDALPKVGHAAVALAAYDAKPIPFLIDTNRRGPFRLDFEVTDTAARTSRRMSYRYNVILPLKGVGDAVGSPFGMNTHMEREPNEHLACNLEMLSQCGVKWIRGWWGWGMAEKQPGHFNWTGFDRQYGLVTDKKMHIMPILLRYYPPYEHAWAGLVDKIQRPPYKLDQWGGFVFETVSRFKRRVRVWEIWNEPGYSAGFTPSLYAQLCKVTYEQARRADPQCKLVGFAGVPLRFMTSAADAGALSAMDIVGEHTYGQLGQSEFAMPERCSEVRSLLSKHSKSMPIWHTEQGTGADGDGYVAGLLTEEECASSLVRGYVCALASGVEKFFWFSAQTSPKYGWAVFYEDYVPRPRLVALNGLASRLEGATCRESLKLGDNAVAYVFQKGRDAVAVMWDLTWPVALHASSVPGDLRIVDMMGNIRTQIRRGAEADVSLRRMLPVYLVFTNTKVNDAAECLRSAKLTEEAFGDIEITKSGAGSITVRITSRAPGVLDAAITVSCRPPLKLERARQFVYDMKPGDPRVTTFRYEPDTDAAPRVVTAVVEAGPFRLRTAKVHTEFRL